MECDVMTYDDIQRSIDELRAELRGCYLTRKERRNAAAQLAELEAQAAALLPAIQAETFPPDR
jgi:hypothetical protein